MSKKPNNKARNIFKYFPGARAVSLFSILLSVVSGALSMTGPYMIGLMLDYCIGPGQVDFARIIPLLFITLGLYSLGNIALYFSQSFAGVAAARVSAALRGALFEKLGRLPVAYLDKTPAGELSSRLSNDAGAVADGLSQLLGQLFSGVAVVVIAFIYMFILHPWLALGVLLISPLTYFIARAVTRSSRKMFNRAAAAQGELSAHMEETLGNLAVLQSYSQQETRLASFSEKNQAFYEPGQKSQFYASLSNPTTRLVNNITFTLAAAVGAYLALTTGTPTVGALLAFLTYSQQYAKPLNELTSVWAQLQQAATSFARIEEVLAQPEEEDPSSPAPPPALVEGRIAFSGVQFSYNPQKPLLQNLTFETRKTSKVAIVGATGSGKTTLLQLLLRFYEIDAGSITIDGTSIARLKRNDLRALFAMVLQDSWIFEGTVKENIAFGRPGPVTDGEVEAAARAALAHRFIEKLPKGYETEINEQSVSEGQKQLISIARAMLASPPMLLLDEATSNIDLRTERSIYRALDALMEGRTSLIVAHRLSTIMDADQVLVMENGRIAEQGTHAELLEKSGIYARLFNSQFLGQTENEA